MGINSFGGKWTAGYAKCNANDKHNGYFKASRAQYVKSVTGVTPVVQYSTREVSVFGRRKLLRLAAPKLAVRRSAVASDGVKTPEAANPRREITDVRREFKP